jgi:nickel/cobalt exporter
MPMGPEQLTALLRQPEWSAPVLATALGVSFVLGAVHALEPGHGKTLVAAYLVGAKGTFRHAMILGGTVTFTHTISVFLLGFATMFLTQYVMPQTIIPILGVISGLMIIGVGVWLLIKQVRHSHDDHHHHDHDVSLGSLITLGASGGLVPCPSALVLLLTSISLGHAGKGLLLLVSFSAGLAIVLTAVGAAVIYGKQLLPKKHHHHHDHHHHGHDHHHHHVQWLPVASAIVIIAAGIVITGTTLQSR